MRHHYPNPAGPTHIGPELKKPIKSVFLVFPRRMFGKRKVRNERDGYWKATANLANWKAKRRRAMMPGVSFLSSSSARFI